MVAGGLASSGGWRSAAVVDERHVLVCGGTDEGGRPVSSCELFDESTGTSVPMSSMTKRRHSHSMVRLGDGRILAVGGGSEGGKRTPTAEIMDPGDRPLARDDPARRHARAATAARASRWGRAAHRRSRLQPRLRKAGGLGYPHRALARAVPQPTDVLPRQAVELPDGRVLFAGIDRTVADGKQERRAGLTTWTPSAAGNDTVRPLNPASSHAWVKALALGPTGRVLVVWAGDDMTSLALLDAELKVVSRSAIEMPREAFLLAGDRALLIVRSRRGRGSRRSLPAGLEIARGARRRAGGGFGQVLVFGTGPLVLGTGPPVDSIAQPCGLIAPFYARWAESLWRPHCHQRCRDGC